MNILFFIESGLGNGKSLVHQALSINEELHDGKIICGASTLDQEPGIINKLSVNGIEVVHFNGLENHKNWFNHLLLLRSLILSKQIDVIHAQTNWVLLLSFLAVILSFKKVYILYTIHGFRNNKSLFKKNVARYLISFLTFICADKIIATCSFIKNNFPLIKYKTTILNLGIDREYIEHSYVSIKNNISLIYPAMFRKGKRQDIIIRSFAKYVQEYRDFNAKLFLPGSGEYANVYKQLVSSLKLDNQVIFPGLCTTKELLSIYDQCNILVCSSISETYCQSIVEGFCLGKCIITTNVGVVPDLLDNKTNGYIFDSEDELYKILCDLSHNRELLSKIGYDNYSKKENFSWNYITQIYLEKILKTLF